MLPAGEDQDPAWRLLEAAPDAMVVVDEQGRIVFANGRTEQLFAYARPELSGAQLESLLSFGHRERLAEQLRQLFAVPPPPVGALDLVGQRKDGRKLAVEITLSPLRIAQAPMAMVALRDLSDRVSAAQARGQLAALLDHIPDYVVAMDPDGLIQFANRVVPPLTPEQVIGSHWVARVSADQAEVMHATFAHVLATGESRTLEFSRAGPGGSTVWLAGHLAPVRQGKRIIGVVAIARDVTEKRRTEAQLVASDRLASVGTLAAGVAHEINNPLASVVTNLALALQELDRVEGHGLSLDFREELRDAREGAERIRVIVRDLKIFSRSEEDRIGPVDPKQVFESTLRIAWNEIRHRARLVKLYGKVPPVDANESRLGQVLLNLLVNAAQAIPEGHSDVNEIRIATRLDASGWVVFEIADTGSGMSPEQREHLFEPFFTTKPAGAGTGLGLAICHRIITALGGKIEVESLPGEGSVFRVYLPPARSEEADAPPVVAVRPGQRRGRVLIIDDEPIIGATIRRLLSAEHEVVISTGANDALDRFRAGERFDVILCDLMMPEVTGAEFYQQLRRESPEQAERVIFLTGGAFTPRAREFLDNVTNLLIEKPFEHEQLRALVNERIR